MISAEDPAIVTIITGQIPSSSPPALSWQNRGLAFGWHQHSAAARGRCVAEGGQVVSVPLLCQSSAEPAFQNQPLQRRGSEGKGEAQI